MVTGIYDSAVKTTLKIPYQVSKFQHWDKMNFNK
jgi:hypothetical protein